MPSLRSRAAVLLLLIAPLAASGCGESEIQRRAREANDVVGTTAAAAVAAQEAKLAQEDKALEEQDRKDRKGLAKDLVDAVDGAAAGARKEAGQQGAAAERKAAAAAQKALDAAQDEAQKVREQADAASQDALDAIAAATSP